MHLRQAVKILAVTASVHLAAASAGDRSAAYKRCLASCSSACPTSFEPSLALRVTGWTCEADCSYRCAQQLTDAVLALPSGDKNWHSLPQSEQNKFERGGELEGLLPGEMDQFHGKWPFTRLWGMQEPLSVLMSLLNLAVHVYFFPRLRALARMSAIGQAYLLTAVIGSNAWVWSAVFHTRDTPLTERLDYFSAASTTIYGLYLAVYRSLRLYADSPSGKASLSSSRPNAPAGSGLLRPAVQLVFVAIFSAHCAYLSLWTFDYSYNMTFNIVIGVLQIALWTTFALLNRQSLPHWRMPLIPMFLILAFTALEVYDFPPWPTDLRVVDAHSLWHASTVGVTVVWYRFLVDDLKWVVKGEQGQLFLRSMSARLD